MTETFPLDTSGRVEAVPGSAHHAPAYAWSDLSPFVQGYVGAMFASCFDPVFDKPVLRSGYADFRGISFSDLAPATLAAILRDCERWLDRYPKTEVTAKKGENAWRYRQEQLVERPDFPPLTPFLSDDGKIYLREGGE